jgi:uncharacterized phage infection (PIP) family protein YhgE
MLCMGRTLQRYRPLKILSNYIYISVILEYLNFLMFSTFDKVIFFLMCVYLSSQNFSSFSSYIFLLIFLQEKHIAFSLKLLSHILPSKFSNDF